VHGLNVLAVEVHQKSATNGSGDIAFGAELVLVNTLAPLIPYTKSNEEWVEFYNRSTNAVNLTGCGSMAAFTMTSLPSR